MTAISPTERALIKSRIEDLITEYGYLFDHGRAAEMAALFTEDAAFHGVAGEARGRAALGKLFTEQAVRMSATRHATSNLRLKITDADHARGRLVVTSYGHIGEGRGTDGKWRVAARKIVIAFSIHA